MSHHVFQQHKFRGIGHFLGLPFWTISASENSIHGMQWKFGKTTNATPRVNAPALGAVCFFFFFVVSAAPADPGAVRVGFVGDPNVEGILGDAILAGGQPRHALTSSLGTPIFMDGSCEHTSKRLG